MMVQVQNDHLLMMILFFNAIILPGIILWFDDRNVHHNGKR